MKTIYNQKQFEEYCKDVLMYTGKILVVEQSKIKYQNKFHFTLTSNLLEDIVNICVAKKWNESIEHVIFYYSNLLSIKSLNILKDNIETLKLTESCKQKLLDL